ncbi:NUDIX hydrolase [Anaerobacillus alkalidiazotrophicus]|uniref:NUDIX hydrolase n=1 Tax=Anaerobacillus alkalidiazotrophicus TaxID=472963 RepID=A0A1S2M861_9BACI|nr:NUDIX hydrolase [Anaerobacillus alkalidiazotrophicus]OIJ20938.1 NUDIX hydrolase [Anaerobacillus alkalidiazotrophicus]
MKKRGNVWLAATGIVIKEGKWLVVKKKYGGLKGLWSFPGGFVDEGETVDQTAVREVEEETGIKTIVKDIVGVRTGVLENVISDNLITFLLEEIGGELKGQSGEIEEVAYMTREELEADPKTSKTVHLYLKEMTAKSFQKIDFNPGDVFNYTRFKVFY